MATGLENYKLKNEFEKLKNAVIKFTPDNDGLINAIKGLTPKNNLLINALNCCVNIVTSLTQGKKMQLPCSRRKYGEECFLPHFAG